MQIIISLLISTGLALPESEESYPNFSLKTMVAWTYQHASKTVGGMPHAKASFYFDMSGALTTWSGDDSFGKINYDIQGALSGGTPINPVMADLLGNSMSSNNLITSEELELSTLVWEQQVNDGFIFRIGKFREAAHFDQNTIAFDSVSGFLAENFNQSITNPFPNYGFGANVDLALNDSTLLALGVVNSEPHGVHTSGISGISWGHLLTTAQLTFTHHLKINDTDRLGHYRFLIWNNGINNPNGIDNINGWGGLFNFDQEISDAITVFARIGWCDEQVTISDFSASAGFQLVLDEINEKSMGLAYQYADLTSGGQQKVTEWYYRTRWEDSKLYIGPVIQYYEDENINGSLVLGFRSTLSF